MSRRSEGEGSIGKRKDGTYYGAIRLDGRCQIVPVTEAAEEE